MHTRKKKVRKLYSQERKRESWGEREKEVLGFFAVEKRGAFIASFLYPSRTLSPRYKWKQKAKKRFRHFLEESNTAFSFPSALFVLFYREEEEGPVVVALLFLSSPPLQRQRRMMLRSQYNRPLKGKERKRQRDDDSSEEKAVEKGEKFPPSLIFPSVFPPP